MFVSHPGHNRLDPPPATGVLLSPRRPRMPAEPLLGSHCWQVGDQLLGDPPHEAAGWYSVFDTDVSTHAAMANLSAALALLPIDR